jgi:hypothetical protein
LGFQTILLKGSGHAKERATKANIDASLASLLAGVRKQDIVLVALCGHGVQLEVTDKQGIKREDAFFCPVDAVLGNPDSLVSLSHLIDGVLATHGGRNLLLIDACRDNPVSEATRGVQGKIVALPENTAVLFACSAGQQSVESSKLGGGHGVFSFCVLETLRKQRQEGGDLTWGQVVNGVETLMEKHPEVQRVLKNVNQVAIHASNLPRTVLHSATDSSKPLPPNKVLVNSLGGEFLPLPGSEQPTRYLGKYEVTQDDWRRVMQQEPSYFSPRGEGKNKVAGVETNKLPIENITWEEATEYCRKLTLLDRAAGKLPPEYAYRLPTVAQWELAAAGSAGMRNVKIDLATAAWFAENSGYRTQAVGGRKANPLGFYDLLGNVLEWCADEDRERPGFRILKGGSWLDSEELCTPARSISQRPDRRGNTYGLRPLLAPAADSDQSNERK